MRKTVLFTVAALTAAISAHSQSVLADWTFESSGLGSTSPNYAPGAGVASTNFYAEGGDQAGTAAATGVHVGAATYVSPAGNGSAKSLSSATWAPGDYYQFQFSTVGDSGLTLSFDQIDSATGPKDFELYYSVDGTTFTPLASSAYSVPSSGVVGTWSASTLHTGSSFSIDLSSSALGLDNQTSVFLELVDMDTVSANGGTVGTGGTDRIDNVLVTANAVPEPSALALLGMGGAAMVGFGRRFKK